MLPASFVASNVNRLPCPWRNQLTPAAYSSEPFRSPLTAETRAISSYEGLSVSPWGVTRSYYPRYPYYYSPW